MSRRSSPYDVSTARPAVAGYRGALSALTFAALLCAALLTPASPAAGAGGDSERTKIAEARHAFSMGALEEAVPERDEIWRRHCYHPTCERGAPERWRHQEADPSDGTPGPIAFEFFWVALPEGVPELAPGHDVMLPRLADRLSHPT